MSSRFRSLRRLLVAFACPQPCILCNGWVVNPDASPLCTDCIARISPLRSSLCWSCGIPIPGNLLERYGICSRCREQAYDFDFARSWGLYEGDLRKIIWNFKYRGLKRLAAPLSHMLAMTYHETYAGDSVDLIVPVPLHGKRRRTRGFDQTLLLARRLSSQVAVPLLTCVRRVRHTPPQFGLSEEERRRNVKNAFSLSEGEALEGKDILVVDDVMTTGATAQEISRLLRDSGNVNSVAILTVARVPKVSL